MNAKTKFLKMYYKLPEKARRELIYGYPNYPMTLGVVMLEVNHDTDLSKIILNNLGYEND